MIARLAASLKILLLIAAALSCNACLFYAIKNPPLARRLVVSELIAGDRAKLATLKQDIIKDYPPSVGVTRTFGFRTVEHHAAYDKKSGFYWPMLAGNYWRNTYYLPLELPRSEPAPELMLTTKEFGILNPLLFGMDKVDVYNAESGQCIAHERRLSLCSYLANVQWLIKPVGPSFDADSEECLVETRELSPSMAYERYTSFCFVRGLLAAGTNNNRPYFQILWIPIPLSKE
ncbi:MAG: hypothetical protein NTX50_07970 [Candidatus Sumerlaeota bacterium]|nr:hypothetical protein [Candidatus Sumerlaeota bacterium]